MTTEQPAEPVEGYDPNDLPGLSADEDGHDADPDDEAEGAEEDDGDPGEALDDDPHAAGDE